MHPQAVAVAMPAASATIGPQAVGQNVAFCGYTCSETSGSAAAVVRIRAGGAVGGTILATIRLLQGTSQTFFDCDGGIKGGDGLYFEKVSGAYEGSVFYA